jgi:hypothetical protein
MESAPLPELYNVLKNHEDIYYRTLGSIIFNMQIRELWENANKSDQQNLLTGLNVRQETKSMTTSGGKKIRLLKPKIDAMKKRSVHMIGLAVTYA